MDASRYHSPSRKSRFRSQSGAAYRPASSPDGPVPTTDEEASVQAEEQVSPDLTPVEGDALDPLAVETPPGLLEEGVEEVPVEPRPEEDNLPAGLRLTRSTDDLRAQRRGVSSLVLALISLFCLAIGGLAGYQLHSKAAVTNNPSAGPSAAERTAPTVALAPSVLADVDAAFTADKEGRFADARQRFNVLADKFPAWVSMRIEAARTTMYERDFEAAEKILTTISRTGADVDAEFLTGLLQMTTQTYDKAEAAFARATALDPARADIFYFWGECVRREGRPRDAAEKFRQALIRNQYETSEGLYQLKLWLSEIQADQEAAKDVNPKIDQNLASGHPSGPALFAAAAREIKAGKFRDAGAYISQAQKVTEPAVFRVVLQDPTFVQENYRPEFAPFYQP